MSSVRVQPSVVVAGSVPMPQPASRVVCLRQPSTASWTAVRNAPSPSSVSAGSSSYSPSASSITVSGSSLESVKCSAPTAGV